MKYNEEAVKLPFDKYARKIAINGDREVGFMQIEPQTLMRIASAFGNVHGIDLSALKTGETKLGEMSELDAGRMMLEIQYLFFALALYDGHYEFETPEIEIELANDNEIVDYARSIMREMSIKPGRLMFGYHDIMRIAAAGKDPKDIDLKNV